MFVPVKFSWATTVVIALDRFLLITKNHLHRKYLTDRIIIIILTSSFLGANIIGLWHVLNVKLPDKILDVNPFYVTLSIVEVSFIIATIALYKHLLTYVRKQAKSMQSNRAKQGQNQCYSYRTTQTMVYVFFSLAVCNITQLIGMNYTIWSKNDDHIGVRNTIFWTTLALYLSSFLNPVILMLRGVTSKQKSLSVSLASLTSIYSLRNERLYHLKDKIIIL